MDTREPLLAAVKRWKIACLGHATRHDSLSNTTLQGNLREWMTSEGNTGWTASKSGHPCPCQNCSHRLPAQKRLEEGSLLNRPSCNPDDPIGKGTELNCIDPSNNILTNFPRLTHRDISCGSQKKKKKKYPAIPKDILRPKNIFRSRPCRNNLFLHP